MDTFDDRIYNMLTSMVDDYKVMLEDEMKLNEDLYEKIWFLEKANKELQKQIKEMKKNGNLHKSTSC